MDNIFINSQAEMEKIINSATARPTTVCNINIYDTLDINDSREYEHLVLRNGRLAIRGTATVRLVYPLELAVYDSAFAVVSHNYANRQLPKYRAHNQSVIVCLSKKAYIEIDDMAIAIVYHNADVVARGNSRVIAYGTSVVHAYDRSRVYASPGAIIKLHDRATKIDAIIKEGLHWDK